MIERPDEDEFEPSHLVSRNARPPIQAGQGRRDMVAIQVVRAGGLNVARAYLLHQAFQARGLELLDRGLNRIKRGARPLCFQKPVNHLIQVWRVRMQPSGDNVTPILLAYLQRLRIDKKPCAALERRRAEEAGDL